MVDFATADLSEQDGNRIELYTFTAGQVNYRYATGQQTILYNGFEYNPEQVTRGTAKLNQDELRNSITVALPLTNAMARSFIGQAIDDDLKISVLQLHIGTTGERYVWNGRVTDCVVRDRMVEFECKSSLSRVAKPGLRAKFQRTCRHTLYGAGCSVSKGSYEVVLGSIAVSGNTVSASGFSTKPDGWFSGGILELESGEKRLILTHTADTVALSRPFITNPTGQSAKAYPGCDKSAPTCQSKYNNLDSYGGFWNMPNKNPFDGL